MVASVAEFSRQIGQILGSFPYTMQERKAILKETGRVDAIEDMSPEVQALIARVTNVAPRTLPRDFFDTRAALSKVDRDIVKHEKLCKLCEANTDPAKIPVHPGCHCDIRTLQIQTGVADPTDPMLLPISRDAGNFSTGPLTDFVLPEGVVLDPSSVAILNSDEMRYEDVLVWLDQMQALLDKADYVAIAIDDGQDTIEEVGAAIEAGSDVLSRRTWLAIAKAVVL